jgi:hypothetical protein
MYLRMAIHAAGPNQEAGIATGPAVLFVDMRGVITAGQYLVTLLAEHRRTPCKQSGVVRAMRVVTGAAVLCRWFMFPEEGPALFGMTGETLLIQCQSVQRLRTG